MGEFELPDEVDGAESIEDLVEVDESGDIDEMSHSTETTED